MIIKLTRVETNESGTYGVLSMNGKPLCITLELPWKYNQANISCIPSGRYKAVKHISPSQNTSLGGECFKLLDVPNRSDILLHIANYTSQLRGCIAVGTSFSDKGISSSNDAMKKILKALPESFILEIHNNIL